MTLVVLFILAVVWLIYLGTWLRSRNDRRGVNSISSFSKHLSVLGRATPATGGLGGPAYRAPKGTRPTPIIPAVGYQPRGTMSLSDARRRRRNVLVSLAGATFVSFVLVPFGGSMMVGLFLVMASLLGGYCFLLQRTQRLAAERRAKVHYLPSTGPAVDGLYLQHSAN